MIVPTDIWPHTTTFWICDREKNWLNSYFRSKWFPGYHSGVETVIADIRETKKIKELLSDCRLLIHLTSETTPGSSAKDPLKELDKNLYPNARLFGLLQDYPNVDLLYLSSGGTVYGDSENLSPTETTPLRPMSYYGATKVASEAFIHALVKQSPRSAVILRPSNIYGPGQIYKPGFGILPTLFNCIAQSEPLPIWGNDKSTRDYIYVDDFTDLCIKIILSSKERYVRTYNVGSGVGTSLTDLISVVEQKTGKTIERDYKNKRGVDVQHTVLDSTLVKLNYNWVPQTSIEKGIEETWNWWNFASCYPK